MGKKTTVELNGKRYDSITGTLLGKTRVKLGATKELKHYDSPMHSGRALDGFVRSTNTNIVSPKLPTVVKNSLSNTKSPHIANQARIKSFDMKPTSKTIPAHKPERPTTLMRSAVSKPKVGLKLALKAQLPAETNGKKLSVLNPKLSAGRVSQTRLAHANNSVKSNYINRFGPANDVQQHVQSIPQYGTPESSDHVASKPPSQHEDDDLFELAIAAATSHQQASPKIKHHLSRSQKVVNTVATLCAVLVVGVFIAYLNLPNIELSVANMNAGIHATLPNYKSFGFSLNGPVKANKGIVAMSFQSGDSSFTLTQQSSNWDNQTLLNSTTTQNGGPPKSIQSDGRTIYLSSDNHAAWVSGGLRYDIAGNANLNPQQISDIAASL